MSDGSEEDAGDEALLPGESVAEVGDGGADDAGEDEAAEEAFDGFSGREPGDELVSADGVSGGVGADVGGFDDADDGQEHPGRVGHADGEEESGKDAEVDDGQERAAGAGHGTVNLAMAAVHDEGANERGGEDGGDEVMRFDGVEPMGKCVPEGVFDGAKIGRSDRGSGGAEFQEFFVRIADLDGDLFEPGPEHAEDGGNGADAERDFDILACEEALHFAEGDDDHGDAAEGDDHAGRRGPIAAGPVGGEPSIEIDHPDDEDGEEEAEDEAVFEHQ